MTWLLLARKFGPYLAIALLLAGLLQTRATLHGARQDAVILTKTQEAAAAAQQAKWATDTAKAADDYAARTSALQPIILHSHDVVTKYAQTPEGRAPCLASERVQSILADRAALFAAASQNSDGAMPARADPTVSPH